jgi:hypothetical protein
MEVKVYGRGKRIGHSVAPWIKWWHLKSKKQISFQDKIFYKEFLAPIRKCR